MLSDALLASAALRVPRLVRPYQPKVLIDALLEHTLETAFHQGELSQERLEAYAELQSLEASWDEMSGWQGLVKAKTDKGVMLAKAEVNPDLYRRIKAGRWLVARLTDEIERLERDAVKASRAYSIVNGS